MRNTSQIGEVSRWQIMAALSRHGKQFLLPVGDHLRYDLAIDDEGKFLRIQCKTGRLRKGVVSFATCSIDSRSQRDDVSAEVIEARSSYLGCTARTMASAIWCRWKKPRSTIAGFASTRHGIGRRRTLSAWKIINLRRSGAGGVRTRDLLNAIQARSQLRHSPRIKINLADTPRLVNLARSPVRRNRRRQPCTHQAE